MGGLGHTLMLLFCVGILNTSIRVYIIIIMYLYSASIQLPAQERFYE